MILTGRTHWIFDMDGTLTVAAHNFEAIRAELGLPAGKPILETLAALPPHRADPLRRRLDEIEWQLACRAKPQPGAQELLAGLHRQGARLGILTRNSRRNACKTLQVCGLLPFFNPECVLGRESAPPKPNPDGICRLLARWNAAPGSAVMVGDYLFDLEAGRRAGAATVHVDINGHGLWPEYTDVRVQNLRQLAALAVKPGPLS